MRVKNKLTKRLAAVALGLLIPLMLTELLVRFGPWQVPDAVRRSIDIKGGGHVQGHERLRYAMRPGLDVEQSCNDLSIYGLRTTSIGEPAIGIRGGDCGGKPFGVMVGDSFTMGVGVEEPATLTAGLERSTGRCFLNFGLGGYGPQQARIMLEQYGLSFQPEVVIWAFFGNDLADAVGFAQWEANGSPVPPITEGSVGGWRNTHWATYKLWRYLSQFHSSRREHWVDDAKDVEYVFTYDMMAELDVTSESVQEGMSLLRAELERFVALAESNDFSPVLILLPFKEQVYEQELREVARRELGELDLWQSYKDVAELGVSLGIPTLDLTPVLQAARDRQIYLVTDPHLSPEGNRIVADAISAFLAGEGLVSG